MNNEFEIIWKEAVVAKFRVLFYCLPEEIHVKCCKVDGHYVKFEPGSSQIWSSANNLATIFHFN
jgi:hypothetical protein